MADESPMEKYERLQRRFQEEILSNYPNPERKGCPGEAALRSLAARPLTDAVQGDPNWQHVTHCSECYREFLAYQAAATQQKRFRRESVRWGIAAAVIAVVLAVVYVERGPLFNQAKRPQNAELAAYHPRLIDIPSMSRGVGGGGERKPFYLNRDREALTIQLPVGSPAGTYQFQLRNQADRAIVTKSAAARIEHGITSFRVKVDLSGLQPGSYKMEIRQVPWDWDYYPVVLR